MQIIWCKVNQWVEKKKKGEEKLFGTINLKEPSD